MGTGNDTGLTVPAAHFGAGVTLPVVVATV